MTGYQETLTDPSYHRQVVVQTAPHIGNTGVNDEDDESGRIWVAGYVVRDPARIGLELAGHRRAGGPAGRRGRGRHQRRRHPGADPAPARARRDAGRRLQRRRRPGGAAGPGPPGAADGRRGPVRRGDHRAAVHGRGRAASTGSPSPRSTWASSATSPRRLAARGVTTHVLPAGSTHRRPAGHRRRTRCSSRPARATRPPPTAPVALAREVLQPADAAVRHLLRQPDPRPGARLRHLQAGVRPPRHQPAGARPGHRQGRGDQPQPRLRACGARRVAPDR